MSSTLRFKFSINLRNYKRLNFEERTSGETKDAAEEPRVTFRFRLRA